MSNTVATAENLGILSNGQSISDFVGTTDPLDYFRFTLAENSNVGFTFRGLSNSIDVELFADFNNNGVYEIGERIDSGSAGSSGSSFSEPLPAGTYFVFVEPRFGNTSRSTDYELNFTIAETPSNVPSDPGETLATAFNLGTLSGTRSLRDYVGFIDPDDIYRFTLAENSDVGFTFRGLPNSVDIDLIADLNNNGVIDRGETIDSGSGGSSGSSFSEPLPSGTYFVLAEPRFGSTTGDRSTQYELDLNVVQRPGNIPTDPGDILANAFNLGTLSGTRTVRDYVGDLDFADIYRFTLDETSEVGFAFRGLSESVDIDLIADLNNNGVIDRGETLESGVGGSDGNSFAEPLDSGTYFVRVNPFFSGRSTQYELTLNRAPNLEGDNSLRGTPGRDIIRGLGGNDALFGLSGNDRLFGGDGNDRLVGGSGNDRLVGGTGFDTLLGGAGNDVMIGGNDNDRLLGAGGRDVLRGNQGNDILNAGGDNDRVFGGDGNDRLNGQAGNDNLRGGAGRDVLTGGPGNDTLNGGLGNDLLIAGPGADRIITILEARAFDRVRDFTPGQDKIVLGGGLSVNQIRLQRQGRNTRVLFGGETFLLLQGVNPGQLSTSDFI